MRSRGCEPARHCRRPARSSEKDGQWPGLGGEDESSRGSDSGQRPSPRLRSHQSYRHLITFVTE